MPTSFSPALTTPILQIGTSRFLQAHADLFVSEALSRGEALGPITIVQTSGDAGRRRRLDALADPAGYPVRIEGIKDGAPTVSETRVKSIRRALALETDLAEVLRIAVDEAEIILSNTGDAQWNPQQQDEAGELQIGMSYPAKLTHLLFARYKAHGRPIQVMPAELLARNGDVLCTRVLALTARFGSGFVQWVERDVRFVNSLVDRIVSEPLEPAGAVAEPYALWAIEDCDGLLLPCRHEAIRVVKSLDTIEKLKLHILNLGHTYLIARWQALGHQAQYVRELIADDDMRADLLDLYRNEVIPVFEAAGIGTEARDYVDTTISRFANPYLDHRLSDIAQNHAEKVRRRLAAFVAYAQTLDAGLDLTRLKAIAASIGETGETR